MEVPSLSSNEFTLLLLSIALVLMAIMDLTRGYDFYAGGTDGWVLYPSESYSHWSGRNRFQVNDSIVFEYEKGKDSVLVVAEHDFYACDLGKPYRRLHGGDDRFTFDHSGSFYFVSGARRKCKQGQKLEVVVMAIRHWSPPSLPPPRSAPRHEPAASPPVSLSPSPSPKRSVRPPATLPSVEAPAPGYVTAPEPADLPAASDAAISSWNSPLGIVIAITQFVLLIQIL